MLDIVYKMKRIESDAEIKCPRLRRRKKKKNRNKRKNPFRSQNKMPLKWEIKVKWFRFHLGNLAVSIQL